MNRSSFSRRNVRQFFVFGIIGVLNTCLHGTLVVFSVENGVLSPVAAHILAFFAVNVFSFCVNSRFTFCCPPTWKGYGKFFSVSLTSLLMTVLLSGFAEWRGWHYLVGLALVILLVPLVTFLLQKRFTFSA